MLILHDILSFSLISLPHFVQCISYTPYLSSYKLTHSSFDDDIVEYNAIIDITAENIMEEEINKKVYCHGRENKDGKIVKKMCGCFLHFFRFLILKKI